MGILHISLASSLMTRNALMNLRHGGSDYVASPSRSAVEVYTAVELLIKARLAVKDWSLVVNRNPDPDRFVAGDFVSVKFEEACRRLKDCVGEPLSVDTTDAFNELRKHRNQIVHFATAEMYLGGSHGRAARNHTRTLTVAAWMAVLNLLRHSWRKDFHGFENDIFDLEKLWTEQMKFRDGVGFLLANAETPASA